MTRATIRPTVEDWDNLRSVIANQYIACGKTLQETQDYIESNYGFAASSKEYKTHLKAWRLKKYNTQSDIRQALQRYLDGDEDAVDSALMKSLQRSKRVSKQTRRPTKKGKTLPSIVSGDRSLDITKDVSQDLDMHRSEQLPAYDSLPQTRPIKLLPKSIEQDPAKDISVTQYLSQSPVSSHFAQMPLLNSSSLAGSETQIHCPIGSFSSQHIVDPPNDDSISTPLTGQAQSASSLAAVSTAHTERYREPETSTTTTTNLTAPLNPTIAYWTSSSDKSEALVGLCRVLTTLQHFNDYGAIDVFPPDYFDCVSAPNPHAKAIAEEIAAYLARARHTLINIEANFIYRDEAQLREPGPAVQFWLAVKHGIYLCKKGKQAESIKAISKAYELTASALGTRCLDSIRELLTTLAPVNTSAWPDLRIRLLRLLHDIMKADFGDTHTLTVITRHLLLDGGNPKVSEYALSFMVEECKKSLGAYHTATVRGELTLIRLLRRSHDHYRAARMAVELLTFCAKISLVSIWTRQTARELAHIFTDLGHRDHALALGEDIVGLRTIPTGSVEISHGDECAIYTMEDMAENLIDRHDFEGGAKWLSLAAEYASKLWKDDWVGAEHVVDKLAGALKACGRPDEINVWRERFKSSLI